MTVPTNLPEARTLLTAIGSDKISGQDLQDVVEWLYGQIESSATGIAINGNTATHFEHTLTTLNSLLTITNVSPGQVVTLAITQDDTGDRHLNLNPASTQQLANDGDFLPDTAAGAVTMYAFTGQIDGSVVCTRNGSADLTWTPYLVIQNGQSNEESIAAAASGLGISRLSHYLGTNGGTRPQTYGWSDLTNTWVALNELGANTRSTTAPNNTPGAGQVGVEYLRMLADLTGRDQYSIALTKTGKGGTYFAPDSTDLAEYGAGAGAHATLNNFNLIVAMVTASGFTNFSRLEYCFTQGEADLNMSYATKLAQLEALDTALDAAFPGFRGCLTRTVGGIEYLGVQRAQDAFVAARTNWRIVNNQDMHGSTAWYGGTQAHYNNGQHYSAQGYRESAARRYAGLLGEIRPSIAKWEIVPGFSEGAGLETRKAVQHMRDVLPWRHAWLCRHQVSITDRQICGVIDDDGVTPVQMVPDGANRVPTHVPYDADFGGIEVVDFSTTTAVESMIANIAETGQSWSIAFAAKSGNTVFSTFFHMYGLGNNTRWGIDVPYTSKWAAFFNGVSTVLDSGPVRHDSISWHHFCFDASTFAYYENGLLAASGSHNGSTNPTTARVFFGAVFNTSGFTGRSSGILLDNGTKHTPQQVFDVYKGARVFHLMT